MLNSQETLSSWFLLNYGLVMTVAFSHAPAPELSKDIAQEAFLEFLQEASETMVEQERRSVLRKVVRRVAKRLWDEKKRHAPQKLQRIGEHLAQIVSQNNDERTSYEEELYALNRCLRKLPDKSRFLVEQHYFMANPSETIAQQLNVSRTAIFQSLYRIRTKLRECVEFYLKNGEKHG